MLTLTSDESDFLQESTEREWAVKLEIIERSSGAVVQTILTTSDDVLGGEVLAIIGGSVRVDTASEVLRALSLELADPFKELSVGIGNLIGLDKLYRVSKGYKIPSPWGSGAYVIWPLGVFALNGEPEIDATHGRRVVRIQGGDKSCLGNGRPRGKFKTAYKVSQGTTKKTAIQALAEYETWAETEFNLTPASTATVPFDLSFSDTDSPWQAARRVAEIPESDDSITRLYYDPYGQLTLAIDPGPDLDNLPAVWTAQPVESGFSQLVGARLVADVFKLRNASRVKWGSTRYTPGSTMTYDNTATSLTYVGTIGWFIEDWKNGQPDPLIRNLAEGQARANFEYKRLLSYQERVPMTLVEHPALEPWDVVQVTEGQADINGKYQLLSFNIDLGSSGVMQADAWRVRSLV
jgi:hypothetical protein